ncbi:hypothetical protein AXF02_10720 [Staphylococcus aureus]|nr:hypothetical protein [Staphylococcus aureus]
MVCRNWGSNFSVLGPRQLALSVVIGDPISLCWGPTPTCIVCRISFRNYLCWGPTSIEKTCYMRIFI